MLQTTLSTCVLIKLATMRCLFAVTAKRKLLDKTRQADLGGFKKKSRTKPTVKEMWDGEEGKLKMHCHVQSV